MKIHQLPSGARFEFEGEEYVKTGPLIGTEPNGKQRLIPKYAVLKPIGEVVAAPEQKSETLPRAQVLDACAAFCAECETLVAADARTAFDAARRRFLRALGEQAPI